MIVDDEEDLRSLLAYDLRKRGYQVSSAGSGKEAVELAGNFRFDLIITDLNLQDMTGTELLDTLLTQKGTLPPVIIITGGDTETEGFRQDYNLQAVLMKPFFPNELNTLVSETLARQPEPGT